MDPAQTSWIQTRQTKSCTWEALAMIWARDFPWKRSWQIASWSWASSAPWQERPTVCQSLTKALPIDEGTYYCLYSVLIIPDVFISISFWADKHKKSIHKLGSVGHQHDQGVTALALQGKAEEARLVKPEEGISLRRSNSSLAASTRRAARNQGHWSDAFWPNMKQWA